MATLPKPFPAKPKKLRDASVAEAKANFSALVRSVETKREEIVVTRRGKAVAKIIPFTETKLPSAYGWMRGSVKILGDIVGPTGEEWDAKPERT